MSDRDRVLASTDLVALIGEHVALRQKGREWVGLCPFHDDKTPSLAVVVHKADAFYKCFACGVAGNAIDFVMEHLRMDFGAALRFLAQRAGITLSPPTQRRTGEVDREALFQANAEALRHRRGLLNAARSGRSRNQAALDAARIIGERSIDDATVDAFQLGAASASWDDLLGLVRSRQLDERAFVAAGLLKRRPRQGEPAADDGDAIPSRTEGGGGCYDAFRNRILFPIFDEAGRPVAFGVRKIDPADEPKYLNSSESAVFVKSRTLYGLHLAKRPIIDAGCAVVTEGYTDVIACHQAGFRNVVATLGTALTIDHARVIRRLCERVVLLFDGDEAGQKAADRAAEVFFAEPVDVMVRVIPDRRDPDELLRLPDGADRFRAALGAATSVLEFLVERFMAGYRGADTMSGRQQRVEAFLSGLVALGLGRRSGPQDARGGAENTLRTRFVLQRLSELLSVPVRELEAAMAAAGPRRRAPQAIVPSVAEDDPSSASPEGEVAVAPVVTPTAVVRAEEFVLGLLIAHPALAGETIDSGEGHRLPVTEWLGPATFLHPPHRDLAEVLLPVLEDAVATGCAPSMQTLLAELARPERRALASSLYFASRQRVSEMPPCGPRHPTADDGVATTASARRPDVEEKLLVMLQQSCADLDSARRRFGLDAEPSFRASISGDPGSAGLPGSPTTLGSSLSDDIAAASDLIDRLRRRGHDPAAIARAARTARTAALPGHLPRHLPRHP